jgi:trimethylamine--corrinoid protein Co-methyltransferase
LGYPYRIPKYDLLEQTELARIQEASLSILNKAGVRAPHRRMLELAADHGAEVDRDRQIIRFPADLVLDSVSRAGKQHILYGMNRDNKAEFGYGMFNFNGSSGQFQICDAPGESRRKPTMADLREAIRIGNRLETINIVGAMVVPSDVPPGVADVLTFRELLLGTSRPFTAWVFDGHTARIIVQMMQIAAGSAEQLEARPFYEVFIEPISPLSFREESIDILFVFAEAGLPIGISPMVQAGATGPCNLAATVAQENAEVLAGIVLTQVVHSGHPVSYGGIAHIMDMKTGTISFGSPEQALMAAALTQCGKAYGLPVYSNTGLSDSKAVDAQYGAESAATLTLGALARSDIFGHLGICGADNAASLVQLLIDDELAAYLTRVLTGLDFQDLEAAAEEIIQGGAGANFLQSERTLTRFRKEFWFPGMFDRAGWEVWMSQGADTVVDRAVRRKQQLLSEGTEVPGDEKLQQELDRLLASHGIDVSQNHMGGER